MNRFDLVKECFEKKAVPAERPDALPSHYFGELTFDRAKMKQYLDNATLRKLLDCIDKGKPLDRKTADGVAAGMKEQLTDRQKTERSEVLLNLTKAQSKCYRECFLGKKLSVLWEDTEVINKVTYVIGHTDRYVRVAVPENAVNAHGAVSGEISKVIPRIFLNDDTLLI